MLIGITGGIGMGKSTVADYLAGRGELLIDSDVLARELVTPGEPALEEIRKTFGESILLADGNLDRKTLASRVFADADDRRKLEGILHPRIRSSWRQQAETWRWAGVKRAFVVIPLLYETAAETEIDAVICVACSSGTQQQRLARRGWNSEEIQRRIGSQLPVATKIDRADGVVWNESSVEVCQEQCDRLVAALEFRLKPTE